MVCGLLTRYNLPVTSLVAELAVEVLRPLEDQNVMEQDNVIFECEVNKADQQATWYQGNAAITPEFKRLVLQINPCQKNTIAVPDFYAAGDFSSAVSKGYNEIICCNSFLLLVLFADSSRLLRAKCTD